MKRGSVRIIAGKWRGRRLKIPESVDLRPTPDRVRETVFNWLSFGIENARCLDLFAGTGVFGFESLSRGAAYVEMVDQSQKVISLLQEELQMIGAKNAQCYRAKIPQQLRTPKQPFDIVFVDPPYQENLLIPTCNHLEAQGFLANKAHIYLEADHLIEDNVLPSAWHIVKHQKAGQVFYHLARREIA